MNSTMSASMVPGKISLKFEPLPDMKIEPPNTAPSLQLYFKISNHVQHKGIAELADGTQSNIGSNTGRTVTACLWIDSGLFNSPEEVHKSLSPELYHLGIWRSGDRVLVVRRIIENMKIWVRSVPRRRKVMVFAVDIFMEIIHRLRGLESDLDRAVRESGREYEERNYGMVAAARSSVRTMMKMVEVEGGGECRICLDEMEEGGFGMSMPCDHVFHANCILKWLQTSHCCPLCRFEMPTGVTYQPVRLG